MLLGSLASGVGAVYLYRQGALQTMGSASLIIQIQRQSGFKRLGVEAHNLAKVDVDVDAEKGVILGVVNAQSPAGRGGLRSGDILVSLNGKTINTPRDVNRIAGRIKKGETMPAQVIRHGETVELEIKF
jgi:serine protease Do